MKQIYLDNASTIPVRPEVLEAMIPYFPKSSATLHPSTPLAKGRHLPSLKLVRISPP